MNQRVSQQAMFLHDSSSGSPQHCIVTWMGKLNKTFPSQVDFDERLVVFDKIYFLY